MKNIVKTGSRGPQNPRGQHLATKDWVMLEGSRVFLLRQRSPPFFSNATLTYKKLKTNLVVRPEQILIATSLDLLMRLKKILGP